MHVVYVKFHRGQRSPIVKLALLTKYGKEVT